MANYSSITQPQNVTIVESGSVSVVAKTAQYNNTNQIFDWITMPGTPNVGEVYAYSGSQWVLSSIYSDELAESIGVIEQVVPTVSESLVKLVYKGFIDFSSDPLISLYSGKTYFLDNFIQPIWVVSESISMSISSSVSMSISTSISSSVSIYYPTSENIVVNGGFETGDFTGWNSDGGNAVGNGSAHSGSYFLNCGNVGSLAYISQQLPTTASHQYSMSFWLFSDGGFTNEFKVTVGDTVVFDQTNIPSQDYTQYSFVFTATGSSTFFQIGARNDPGYLRADDFSVIDQESLEPSSSVQYFTQTSSVSTTIDTVIDTVINTEVLSGSIFSYGPDAVYNVTSIEPDISKPIYTSLTNNTAIVTNMRGHVNDPLIVSHIPTLADKVCPPTPPLPPTSSLFLYVYFGDNPPI